jgi:hypothetical protein
VDIGFQYKRIPLCASRLLRHAGVRTSPAALAAVVKQVRLDPQAVTRKQTPKGVSKIGSWSVCRVVEPILS